MPNELNHELIDNTAQKRFEIHVDGYLAFEDYEFFTTSQGEKGIAYLHTEVAKELSGRGIASYLVRSILDEAAAKHLRVKPICPYVRAYIHNTKTTLSFIMPLLNLTI